jgi:hypothetical protein
MPTLMLKGSDIKGINTYHYTFILNTQKKCVNEQGDISRISEEI